MFTNWRGSEKQKKAYAIKMAQKRAAQTAAGKLVETRADYERRVVARTLAYSVARLVARTRLEHPTAGKALEELSYKLAALFSSEEKPLIPFNNTLKTCMRTPDAVPGFSPDGTPHEGTVPEEGSKLDPFASNEDGAQTWSKDGQPIPKHQALAEHAAQERRDRYLKEDRLKKLRSRA